MKRILIAFCVFSLSTAAIAQTSATSAPVTVVSKKKASDAVKFSEEKHDFGKIKQGVPVTYDFTFQNISNQPIVIEAARASCGCTTPTWPQAPVTKGKSDKITAGFNAASAGPFDKTITVTLAGYDQPLELKITGEVLSAENYAKYEAGKAKKNSK
jgi:hypothetical protein